MSLRIAFAANTSWFISNLRLGIIKALQKEGHEITVIAPYDRFTDNLIHEDCHFLPVRIDNAGVNPFRDLHLIVQLYRIYRRERFDIIFHYTIKPNIYGAIAAGLSRSTSISIVSGRGLSFSKKNMLFHLSKRLYRFSSVFAKEIWFVNPDDREFFIQEKIVPHEKTNLLPGEGVDATHFSPRPGNQNGRLNFLVSARLLWSKGIGEYVEAAKIIGGKYSNVTFSMLGYLGVENPDRIPSETIYRWHHEGIIDYLGFTDDVRHTICHSDCIILPSYYGEGIPRSLLEAASMEIPIITTDHAGCREVVQDGYNGYLCKERDVADLVQKIEDFIALSDQERREMGKNGRKLVLKRFKESLVIEYYLNTICDPMPDSLYL
ncbi:MAG: glycosyltransferase family 4 protein [Bacteroidia bacterium]|nr:glycosyltransferase family 4 protein [Bacteroidia bacterium]